MHAHKILTPYYLRYLCCKIDIIKNDHVWKCCTMTIKFEWPTETPITPLVIFFNQHLRSKSPRGIHQGIRAILWPHDKKNLISRDTWSNRQVWPWSTKWNRAEVNRILPRECTGHSKHLLPTTQGVTLRMDITRWPIPKPDCLYSLQLKTETLYIVRKIKTRIWLWLRSQTPLYCKIQI